MQNHRRVPEHMRLTSELQVEHFRKQSARTLRRIMVIARCLGKRWRTDSLDVISKNLQAEAATLLDWAVIGEFHATEISTRLEYTFWFKHVRDDVPIRISKEATPFRIICARIIHALHEATL